MLMVVLTGIAALAAAVLAGLVHHRAPTRLTCPTCSGATSAVRPPGILGRTPGVTWRWCAACGWEGVGRDGPDWRPGRKVAHQSGFLWGDERLPEDFGFRWRPRPERDAALRDEPPHHPSGFRFGPPTADPAHESGPPVSEAHPSGFRWARGEGDDAGTDEGGFHWGEPRQPSAPDTGFRWGGAAADTSPEDEWTRREGDDGPAGFRWRRSG